MEAPPLPYWPIPIPEGPVYDSSAHHCEYCDALEVTVPLDPKFSKSSTVGAGWVWSFHIPYTRERINKAAADGCMFFVWAQSQLTLDGGKLVSEYHPVMRDDPDQEPDCESWFVFRFGIAATQLPEPSREDLIPANIGYILFSFCTKEKRWDRFLHPISRLVASRLGKFQPRVHGIESCLVGPISSPKILLQIRERLVDCFQYHKECHRDFPNSASIIRPIRFLNVDPLRSPEHVNLTTLNLDSRRPYVTLSYVWGHGRVIKTTLATLTQHESGISLDSLPATIRDAILVTRFIGVDLLWVDSLCIVQDDPNELAFEIANMASYYGNALITLRAAAADCCVDGFLDKGCTFEKMDWFQFDIPFATSAMSCVRIPFRPHYAQRHPLDHRAWALTETLLSRRLVTIGSQTTPWCCQTVTHGVIYFAKLRKDIIWFRSRLVKPQNATPGTILPRKLWRDRDPVSELVLVGQLLGSPYLPDSSPSYDGSDEFTRPRWPTVESTLAIWFLILVEYTKQLLSDPLDILNGISGIAQELSGYFPDNPCGLDAPKYLAGLWWTDYFPVQLLWRPDRICSCSTVYTAPSWSWASISTPFQMLVLPLKIDSRVFQHLQVITSHVERRSPRAPYGAVTGGHLLVKGKVIRVGTGNSEIIENYRITLGGDTQEISTVNLGTWKEGITLLEILTEWAMDDLGWGSGLNVRGLILERREDGTYQRIGIFGHELEKGGWDQPRGEELERQLKWRDHLFSMPWETEILKIV